MKPSPPQGKPIDGVVTARVCDCCGHHEIGVVDAAGEYIPLRPGMRVTVIDESPGKEMLAELPSVADPLVHVDDG